MLPTVVIEIIDSYVKALDEFSDLPCFESVRRIVKYSDDYVLDLLGTTLGPGNGVRFRLTFDNFSFFFQLNASQRAWLTRKLQLSMATNLHISRLIWIMVVRKPNLVNYPNFQKLFSACLYCRLMSYLMTVGNAGYLVGE